VQENKSFNEIEQIGKLVLLDEVLFDLVSSGLSALDFNKVQTDLLSMQQDIQTYQREQQAFYWYNLAVCSRQLHLSSEQVIPHIEKALSFTPDVNAQQHFKILTKAIDLATDYQQYYLLISYIEQLRELTKNELNPLSLRLPEKYENLNARAYYETGQLVEAELYFTLLIGEAEKNHSPHNVNWYTLLGAIHQIHKDTDKEVSVLRKQLELFPSLNREQHLVWLLNDQKTIND
jgi:tetratricopeptide (TPR) repeat protein